MMACSSGVLFAIRSAGERTEGLCRQALIRAGANPDNVITIREAPFTKSLRASFQYGIDSGLDWLYCVDADVIVRDSAVSRYMKAALHLPMSMLGLQGMMLDKLTLSFRAGGVHLYRVAHLARAMECIPVEGKAIRPESSLIRAMGGTGHGWRVLPCVAGIHDFGQYQKDLFRKAYVHANKHMANIPRLLPIWRELARKDHDFVTAIAGLCAGLHDSGPIHIDSKHPNFERAWLESGISESSSKDFDCMGEEVEDILRFWAREHVVVREFVATREQIVDANDDLSDSFFAIALRKYQAESAGKKFPSAMLSLLGSVLTAAGSNLKYRAQRSKPRARPETGN